LSTICTDDRLTSTMGIDARDQIGELTVAQTVEGETGS
jgi:hypothetical protein